MTIRNKEILIRNIKLFLYCAIFATIIISWLPGNSFCIILLGAVWLAERNFKEKFSRVKKDIFFIAYAFYFLLQASSFFYTNDFSKALNHVVSQLGFLILPFIICSSLIEKWIRDKAFLFMNIALILASLYCLGVNYFHYLRTGDVDLFFYHSLVAPINQHAVYLSIFVFVGILFLIYENIPNAVNNKQKLLYISMAVYLSFFLVLLASKLILSAYFFFISLFFIRYYLNNKKIWPVLLFGFALLTTLSLVILTDSPVKERFLHVKHGHLDLLNDKKFTPITDFNGLNLRLVFWRFTYEILTENDALITGVGPATSQDYLNAKYISMGMYLGDDHGSSGFLGYNCHNQFLQTTLGSGIIGSIVFLFWCIALFLKTYRMDQPLMWGTTFILLIFFTTESAFFVQWGMNIYTVLPLLILYSRPQPIQEHQL